MEEKIEDKNGWGQVVREVALAGLATVFMTEDSVKKYIKELKIPKELVQMLLENVGKKKDDLYGVIGREVGQFLSKIDAGKEISKLLQGYKIKLSVTFEPKEKLQEEEVGNA